MLTTRQQSLFSLTVITLLLILIIHSLPVLAGSRLFSSLNQQKRFLTDNKIANQSLVTSKQHASSLLHQLNLTTSQREQIKQIHHRYKQQIRKKRHNLSILQKQLSDSIVGTESVEFIRAQNQQLVNLRREIEQLRFETILETREILTPEQRKKFREIVKSQLTP